MCRSDYHAGTWEGRTLHRIVIMGAGAIRSVGGGVADRQFAYRAARSEA
jgi:hypothetical protein